MTPAFSSWQAFFAMGGYAFYVWLAVAISVMALCGLVAHTVWQRRRLLADIGQRLARERRIQAAKRKKHADKTAGDIL
ncbi:Heme exporter protein D [Paramixta manurensis]|uniref:Heme exporter protein D n=1 Tax=Paramixta manurensis TaxID=2740817 RepID=A0A6M8UM73_9GAMM|nr:Heme exporter protein D [Erwiniaceae bacterium PD-1]